MPGACAIYAEYPAFLTRGRLHLRWRWAGGTTRPGRAPSAARCSRPGKEGPDWFLHMRELGSRDAGSLCLNTWSRGRAWPHRCNGGLRARLAGEAQIERFSGAWLGACELRVRGSYVQRASMQEQPIHLGNQSTSCSAILHAHRQPNGGHLHAQDLAQWSLPP